MAAKIQNATGCVNFEHPYYQTSSISSVSPLLLPRSPFVFSSPSVQHHHVCHHSCCYSMTPHQQPNSLPTIPVSLSCYTVPAAVPTAPYPPSPVEARYFYYGIPSQPPLVARPSVNIWVEPTGREAYLPKEYSPIGLHPLREIWEATVGPTMIDYLDSKGAKCTSLDPVRMGTLTSLPLPLSYGWELSLAPSLPRMASRSRLTARVSFLLTISTTSTSKFASRRSSAPPVPRCTVQARPHLQCHRPDPRAFLHCPWSPHLRRS